MFNPSGQAWLLLAFPDGTEGDALRMFESDIGDQQAGVAGVHRIALAGPAYEGVAVLARGLLGPKPVLDSNGALSFETIFWRERGAGVDPGCWSVGCFRNRDQLMPIFLIRIKSQHSDLQGEVNRLKRKNDDLQSQLKSRSAPVEKEREALRSRERRVKNKSKNCLDGHTRVEMAGIPQPKTKMLRIDFGDPETEHENQRMKEANARDAPAWGRGPSRPPTLPARQQAGPPAPSLLVRARHARATPGTGSVRPRAAALPPPRPPARSPARSLSCPPGTIARACTARARDARNRQHAPARGRAPAAPLSHPPPARSLACPPGTIRVRARARATPPTGRGHFRPRSSAPARSHPPAS